VPVTAPFRWLSRGWRDLRRTPGASLFHGLAVALGGLAIVAVALRFWQLLPGAVSGFLLVGPILATGLYELSRRLDRGQPATLRHAVSAWLRGTRPLVWVGVVLVLAATIWVLLSALLFALLLKTPVGGVEDAVRQVLSPEGLTLFTVWVGLGGFGAALVFAGTVVSVPLLLDRDHDTLGAVLTSVRAVADNPLPMAVWAVLVMVATVLSLATLMLGFVISIPLIGHATWHAYRDLVDSEGLAPRP
jgi:uncharacterized membrane protein